MLKGGIVWKEVLGRRYSYLLLTYLLSNSNITIT